MRFAGTVTMFRTLQGFGTLVSDTISDHLEDWDNLSRDETVPNIASVEDCAKACANNANCSQSLYNGDECTLGTKRIIFGVKDDSKDGKKWQSGWNKPRIAEWVSNQQPCDTVIFPFHIPFPELKGKYI
jgi:hypothetical protein